MINSVDYYCSQAYHFRKYIVSISYSNKQHIMKNTNTD